jgi:hypothetical protein
MTVHGGFINYEFIFTGKFFAMSGRQISHPNDPEVPATTTVEVSMWTKV